MEPAIAIDLALLLAAGLVLLFHEAPAEAPAADAAPEAESTTEAPADEAPEPAATEETTTEEQEESN